MIADFFRIGDQVCVSSFVRMPRMLFFWPELRALSAEAKLLYSLLLDRACLSSENQWFDMDGRVYVYYTIADIQYALNCSKNKALKILAELDCDTGIGLVRRKKQGLGKPDKLYVKVIDEERSRPRPSLDNIRQSLSPLS